jgi:hypothetical protein
VKVNAIGLDSVRNEVFLLGLVATISWVFGTKDCDLVSFEDGNEKVSGMKDILCISMEVNDSFLFFEAVRVGHLDVGHLLAILSHE